jgi:ABC-2 type transport system permease protein
MSTVPKVLFLEAKNFLLGRTIIIGAISLLLFGFYGFFHGSQVISRQQQSIASVPEVQKHHLSQIVGHGTGKPVGTTAYYPFFIPQTLPLPGPNFRSGSGT